MYQFTNQLGATYYIQTSKKFSDGSPPNGRFFNIEWMDGIAGPFDYKTAVAFAARTSSKILSAVERDRIREEQLKKKIAARVEEKGFKYFEAMDEMTASGFDFTEFTGTKTPKKEDLKEVYLNQYRDFLRGMLESSERIKKLETELNET